MKMFTIAIFKLYVPKIYKQWNKIQHLMDFFMIIYTIEIIIYDQK